MKSLVAACVISFLPALAFAQPAPSVAAPDASSKPQPFEPIVAKEHSGLGRIGVRLDFDKTTGLPKIAALTRGGPAADFGFRVGDVIIKIGKNYTYTLTEDEVRLALHGDPGTGVELTVQRDDDPHFIVCAVARRIIPGDQEEMTQPPMSEVANP